MHKVNLMNQAALLNRGALQPLFPQGTMTMNPQQRQQIGNVGALQSTNFNLQAAYRNSCKMIIKLLYACPLEFSENTIEMLHMVDLVSFQNGLQWCLMVIMKSLSYNSNQVIIQCTI